MLGTPVRAGPHGADRVLGEYDGNNNLLRKYMYGPGIDQPATRTAGKPVCMIEVADANATYYYHFDALGSVVALSDAAGDTVHTYEYSVYGEVAVEDANHTNPYMFAGVRYDIEIGLYYNRARYYNPFTGRFLQTDPVGYADGMNWYAYCKNNPLNFLDPFGLAIWGMSFSKDEDRVLVFDWVELDPNDEDFERNMQNYDFLLETDDPLDRRRLESAVRQLWGLETGENLLSKTRGLGIIIETQRGIYVGEGQDRHRVCGKAPWDTNKIVWDPTYVTADQPAFITVGHELIHKYHDMVLEPAGKGVMAPTTDELLEVEEARTYGYTLWYGSGDARRTYNFSRGENMDENQLRIEANQAYGMNLALRPNLWIP